MWKRWFSSTNENQVFIVVSSILGFVLFLFFFSFHFILSGLSSQSADLSAETGSLAVFVFDCSSLFKLWTDLSFL
jgi:hypothetical protein